MTEKKRNRTSANGLSERAPDYMSRQSQVTWRFLVGALGEFKELNPSDAKLLEMYCTQYELYRNAYKHIQENGEVQAIYASVQNAAGEVIGKDFKGYKRNPMTQIYNDAVKNLNSIGAELGLSPKSRRALFGELVKDDGDAAEIMKLFGGN